MRFNYFKKKKMKKKQYSEEQKKAIQETLTSVQEKTKETDQRIEQLRRIAKLGSIPPP